MNPSWYDLLDVEPDASGDQIKTAWKAAIADLDPTDRKFRVYNQAAEVLLDPQKRAAYDAELAAVAAVPADEGDEELETDPVPLVKQPASVVPTTEPTARPATPVAGGRLTVPGWLLVALAVVTALVVGVCAYVWFERPSDSSVEDSTRTAQNVAERAVVPILSYDAADLAGSKATAESYLTPAYRKEYDQLFAGIIQQNAPSTETVVKAEFLASGIVRSGEDRVQVLVLVNQSRTNKLHPAPVVFKNYVTITMQRVDGDWLVAGMDT